MRMRRRSGCPIESDSEHIKNFALHPVGPGPDRDGRGERRDRGRSRPHLTTRHLDGVEVLGARSGPRTGPGPAGIAQVIGRAQLGEQIEAALVLEHLEQFDQPRRRYEQSQVVAKPRVL